MKFIYTEYLWALLMLAIPLLIHFFQFKRYKTVYFSQVAFLKAVTQQTKKKQDLKKLLILLCRLFALATLIIAFCQPYIPSNKVEFSRNKEVVVIYLDNSFSMRNQSETGPLLEVAKTKVIDLANSMDPGVQYFLISNDVSIEDQLPINKDQLINKLSKIQESSRSLNFNEVYSILSNYTESYLHDFDISFYFFSDFQEHFLTAEIDDNDRIGKVFLIQLSAVEQDNIIIDSCWFETPTRKAGSTEKLLARIINNSEQNLRNHPLQLIINDSLKAISTLNMEAGEEKIVELNYRNGNNRFHTGTIQLEDFPLTYDNTLFLSYEVKEQINCLLLHHDKTEGIENFQAIFDGDAYINYKSTDARKLQYDELKANQLIILYQLDNIPSGLSLSIKDYVSNGGFICIVPGKELDQSSFNNFYENLQCNQIITLDSSLLKIDQLNYEHYIFKDVFKRVDEKLQLPEIKQSYRYNKHSGVDEETLMRFINGEPALTKINVGKGGIYNFCFPFSGTNNAFLNDALFVSIVYNIAVNSVPVQENYFNIENLLISEVQKELSDMPPFDIKKSGDNEQYRIPVLNEDYNYARLDFSNLVTKAGIYELSSNDQIIKKIAFNYNRHESKSRQMQQKEILEKIEKAQATTIELVNGSVENFSEELMDKNEGNKLWYYFVILALIFLVTESAIIRWMK